MTCLLGKLIEVPLLGPVPKLLDACIKTLKVTPSEEKYRYGSSAVTLCDLASWLTETVISVLGTSFILVTSIRNSLSVAEEEPKFPEWVHWSWIARAPIGVTTRLSSLSGWDCTPTWHHRVQSHSIPYIFLDRQLLTHDNPSPPTPLPKHILIC